MQEKSVDKTFYNNGGWHHGNGVLCVGSLRIAAESFDTNPDNEVKNEVFEYICETLNAKWKANIKIEALQKDKAELIEYAEKLKILENSICIFAREELGNMNFESDKEVIGYILSFTDDA